MKGHSPSKAICVWRQKNSGAEPEPEPSLCILNDWIPAAAEEAGGFVVFGEACFQLVPAGAGNEDERVEGVG